MGLGSTSEVASGSLEWSGGGLSTVGEDGVGERLSASPQPLALEVARLLRLVQIY